MKKNKFGIDDAMTILALISTILFCLIIQYG